MSNKSKATKKTVNNGSAKIDGTIEPKVNEQFLKVWDSFWAETEKNPDAYLFKYLRVELPDHYEPIRKILNGKSSNWDKDKAIRSYFKDAGMLKKAKAKKVR
jgi:hypothetical protein